MRRNGVVFLAITALAIIAVPVCANTIVPGTSGVPDVFAGLPIGSMKIAPTISGGFVTPGGDGGTYWSEVWSDGATGKLDFLYWFDAAGANPDQLARMTVFGFKGFSTDVGYDSTSVGVAPVKVNRSASGNVVGFFYDDTATPPELAPGKASRVLVVKTDAEHYRSLLNMAIIDGGSTNVKAYAPIVPLPGAAWASFGMLGLLGIVRMRKAWL